MDGDKDKPVDLEALREACEARVNYQQIQPPDFGNDPQTPAWQRYFQQRGDALIRMRDKAIEAVPSLNPEHEALSRESREIDELPTRDERLKAVKKWGDGTLRFFDNVERTLKRLCSPPIG